MPSGGIAACDRLNQFGQSQFFIFNQVSAAVSVGKFYSF